MLRRLTGDVLPEVAAATRSLDKLIGDLEPIIKNLSWKDFELLVDLIFRNAGWQRVSAVGSTMKALDLDLISPITSERYGVQVKASATLKNYEHYRDEVLSNMPGFARLFFVVHSPDSQLAAINNSEDASVRLLLPRDVARLATQYGLTKWIIDKVS